MNEKRIQQVLEIEKQAQAAYQEALKEATDLPAQAEQEAQLIIEKTRAEADQEARQIMEKAQSEEESNRIMNDAQEKVRRTEALATSNLNRAVAFVLNRVAGKE